MLFETLSSNVIEVVYLSSGGLVVWGDCGRDPHRDFC